MTNTTIPWLRIGAEFLVIFAGITLSLAADDWMQHRSARELERELLVGIQADLAADSADLERIQLRGETWDEGAVWLRLRIASGPALPADSVMTRLRPVLFFSTYQPVTSTYVTLKDGGGMLLIRDSALRALITAYYEVHQPSVVALHQITLDENFKWRGLARPFWEVPLADTTSRHWPIRGMRFTGTWTDFAAAPAIRAGLVEVGIAGGNIASSARSLLARNSELRAAVSAALPAS